MENRRLNKIICFGAEVAVQLNKISSRRQRECSKITDWQGAWPMEMATESSIFTKAQKYYAALNFVTKENLIYPQDINLINFLELENV
uniref:Uncharacterized protein n=1 Tax=Candidatus Kentrum sp. MB TaxID=2138164 RepID=A0A450XL05_9GAMM|nr:MAG: hypothetical protein BECKMB1821G_GA0114241_101027 [Candidatus Kentron sp. MB]VFK30010.1 MAG: hypothetical protein BECKMB1821I_GA0114274_101311 [Candidatus Kentron sp. MB]VFK75016.1 MAG: hypothetical protein BECKMB1821H_GA0114242_101412 [Candidatus Kentron sp. MB]